MKNIHLLTFFIVALISINWSYQLKTQRHNHLKKIKSKNETYNHSKINTTNNTCISSSKKNNIVKENVKKRKMIKYPVSKIDPFTLHNYSLSNTSIQLPSLYYSSSYLSETYLLFFFGYHKENNYNTKIYLYDLVNSNISEINYEKNLLLKDRHSTSISKHPNDTSLWFYGGFSKRNVLNDLVKFDLISKHFSVESLYYKNITKKGRYGHKASFINSTTMIVFGGKDNDENYLNDLLLINLSNHTIVTVNNSNSLPSPRSDFIFEQGLNDSILLFGGNSKKGPLNDMYVIELKSLNWSQINQSGTIPSPRSHMGYIRKNETFSIIAGGCDELLSQCYGDIFYLDLINMKWTKILNKRWSYPPRGQLSLIIYRSDLFLFGGCDFAHCYSDVYMMRLEDINKEDSEIIEEEECDLECNNGRCYKQKCICDKGFIGQSCNLTTIVGDIKAEEEKRKKYKQIIQTYLGKANKK